eukprot:TRINITY_DN4852_c0_g1_i1.p1 TRINITY_DN4852_c0_g1~~TRINITY_DN4852_c0_g1_i1.p1  ORF type:complete len:2785 (+),score=771.66 TRINITY_DN4852_c0_g1_i1:54-8408(+)
MPPGLADRWRPYRQAALRRPRGEPPPPAAGLTPSPMSPESCVCVAWRDALFAAFRGGLYCLPLPPADANPARPVGGWMEAEVSGEGPTGMLAAGAVFGSQLVVHGGVSTAGRVTGEMYAVDLERAGRRWTKVQQLPAEGEVRFPGAVCHHTLTLVPQRRAVVLHGGVADLGTQALTDHTWEFDMHKQKWRPLPPSGVPRSGHSACVWEDRLLVTGGVDSSNTLCWTVQTLSFDARVWQTIADASPLSQQVLLSPMVADVATGTVWWSGGAQLTLTPPSASNANASAGAINVSGTFSSSAGSAGSALCWRLFTMESLPNLDAASPWAAEVSKAGGVVWYVQEGVLWMFKSGVWISRAFAGGPPPSNEECLVRHQPQWVPQPPHEQDEHEQHEHDHDHEEDHTPHDLPQKPEPLAEADDALISSPPPPASLAPTSTPCPCPPPKPRNAQSARVRGGTARAQRHQLMLPATAGRRPRAATVKATRKQSAYTAKVHTTNLVKRVIWSAHAASARGGAEPPPREDAAPVAAAAVDAQDELLMPAPPPGRLTSWGKPVRSGVLSRLLDMKSDSLAVDLSGLALNSGDMFRLHSVLRSHPSIRKVTCAHVPFLDSVSSKTVLRTLQENTNIVVWSLEGTTFENQAHQALIVKQLAANQEADGRRNARRARAAETAAVKKTLEAARREREAAWEAHQGRLAVEFEYAHTVLRTQQLEARGFAHLEESRDFSTLLLSQIIEHSDVLRRIAAAKEAEAQRADVEGEEEAVREEVRARRHSELCGLKNDEKREKRLVHELLLRRAKQQRTERDALFVTEKEARGRVRDAQDAEHRELQKDVEKLNKRCEDQRKLRNKLIEEEYRQKIEAEAAQRREQERRRFAEEEEEKRQRRVKNDFFVQEANERLAIDSDHLNAFFKLTTVTWDAEFAAALEAEAEGCAFRELARLETVPPMFTLKPGASPVTAFLCASSPTVLNRPLATCRCELNIPIAQHIRDGVMYEHNTETEAEIIERRNKIESGTIFMCIRPDRSWGGVGAELHLMDMLESQRYSPLRVHDGCVYLKEGYAGDVGELCDFVMSMNDEAPPMIGRRRSSKSSQPSSVEFPPNLTVTGEDEMCGDRLLCTYEALSPDLPIDEFANDYLGLQLKLARRVDTTLLDAVFDLVTLTLPYGSVEPATCFSLDVEASLSFSGGTKSTNVFLVNLESAELPMALSEKHNSRHYTEGSGKLRLISGAHVHLKKQDGAAGAPSPLTQPAPVVRAVRGARGSIARAGRRQERNSIVSRPDTVPGSPDNSAATPPPGPEYLTVLIHGERLGREDRLLLDGGNCKHGGYRVKDRGWLMEKRQPPSASPAPGSLAAATQASQLSLSAMLSVSGDMTGLSTSASFGALTPQSPALQTPGQKVRPPPPPYASCAIEVRRTHEDLRAALRVLMFMNDDNNPEEDFERVFTISVEDPAVGFPVIIGTVRVQIMGTDDPSVVDFGMYMPAWRQVARDVPPSLQEYVPGQEHLRVGVMGYISDVDTTDFQDGYLTVVITHGGGRGDSLCLDLAQSQLLHIDGEAPDTVMCGDEVVATVSYPHPHSVKFTFGKTGASIERACDLFHSVSLRVEGRMPQKEGRHISLQADFKVGNVAPVRASRTFRITPPLLTNPPSHASLTIKEGAGKVALSTKFDVIEGDDGWGGGFIHVDIIEGGTEDDAFSLSEKYGFKTREADEKASFMVGSDKLGLPTSGSQAGSEGVDEALPVMEEDPSLSPPPVEELASEAKPSKRTVEEVTEVVREAAHEVGAQRLRKARASIATNLNRLLETQRQFRAEAHDGARRESFAGAREELLYLHDHIVGRVITSRSGLLILLDPESQDRLRECAQKDKVPARRDLCCLKRQDIQRLLKSVQYQNTCSTSADIDKKVVRVQLSDGLVHTSYTIHEIYIEPVDTATEIVRLDPTIGRTYHQGCPTDVNGFLLFEDCYLHDPDTFCFNGGRMELRLFSGVRDHNLFDHRMWMLSLDEQIDCFTYLQTIMSPTELRRAESPDSASAHPDSRRRSRQASVVFELQSMESGDVFKGTGVNRLCTQRRRNSIFDEAQRAYILVGPDGELFHRVGLAGYEKRDRVGESLRKGSQSAIPDYLLEGAVELGRLVKHDTHLMVEFADLPDHFPRPESLEEAAGVPENISLQMVEDLLYVLAYRNLSPAVQHDPYFITFQATVDAGPNSVPGKTKLQFKVCGPTVFVPGKVSNAVVEYIPHRTPSPFTVSPKIRTQWASHDCVTDGLLLVTLEGSRDQERDHVALALEGTAFSISPKENGPPGTGRLMHGGSLYLGDVTMNAPTRILIRFTPMSNATGGHLQQLLRLVSYCYAPPERTSDNIHNPHTEGSRLDNNLGLSRDCALEECQHARIISVLLLVGSPDSGGTVETEVYISPFRRTAVLRGLASFTDAPAKDGHDALEGSLHSAGSLGSLHSPTTALSVTYRATSAPAAVFAAVRVCDSNSATYAYPSYIEAWMEGSTGDMLFSEPCGLLGSLDDSVNQPAEGVSAASPRTPAKPVGQGGPPPGATANIGVSFQQAHIVGAPNDILPRWHRHVRLPPTVFGYETIGGQGRVGLRITFLDATKKEVEELIHSIRYYNSYVWCSTKGKNAHRKVHLKLMRARAIESCSITTEVTVKPPFLEFPSLRDGVARLQQSVATRFLQNPSIIDLPSLAGASLNVKLYVLPAGMPYRLTLIDERCLPAQDVTVALGKKTNPETIRRFCSAIQVKAQGKPKRAALPLTPMAVVRLRLLTEGGVLQSMHFAVTLQKDPRADA